MEAFIRSGSSARRINDLRMELIGLRHFARAEGERALPRAFIHLSLQCMKPRSSIIYRDEVVRQGDDGEHVLQRKYNFITGSMHPNGMGLFVADRPRHVKMVLTYGKVSPMNFEGPDQRVFHIGFNLRGSNFSIGDYRLPPENDTPLVTLDSHGTSSLGSNENGSYVSARWRLGLEDKIKPLVVAFRDQVHALAEVLEPTQGLNSMSVEETEPYYSTLRAVD